MRPISFRGYRLHYVQRDAAESMVRQADEFPSFFTPTDDSPLVIDCGSNIGVSMMEWKSRWPGSRVLCFEPDPQSFVCLQTNVQRNQIPGVRCVNAAVAAADGAATFYGDLTRSGDARGNSIDPAWGRRDDGSSMTVRTVRLSAHLTDEPVTLLKLDIEGAEQSVLEEIRGWMDQIEAIYVEVHETRLSADRNSVAAITDLLSRAGYRIEVQPRRRDHSLPPHLSDWQRRVDARQTQVLAYR